MDGNITSVIIMIICILLSAFFSAAETSFSSLNRIRMLSLAEEGNRKAQKVLDTVEKYDRLLSTVLIGNNIVNILLTSLTTALFIKLSSTYGTTLATVTTTVVVLLFGEITPKTIAKKHPEDFAMAILPLINFFIVILTPLSFLFTLWTKLVTALSGGEADDSITDNELITIVNEAYNEGGLDEHESELIRNAITFDDRQAEDILTPRVDIVAYDIEDTEKDLLELFTETGYSRIPVYEDSLDNIIGIIHQRDFYEDVEEGGKTVKEIIKPALFVAPTMKISKLLRQLQKKKEHIAVVVDEYGGTAGLVTMEDILEELVGEIWDEHDEVVENVALVEGTEDTYIVQGTLNLEEMLDFFEIKDIESDADTVSGWVMECLGKIPEEHEKFTFDSLEIEISEIVARRITEVKIKKNPVAAEAD